MSGKFPDISPYGLATIKEVPEPEPEPRQELNYKPNPVKSKKIKKSKKVNDIKMLKLYNKIIQKQINKLIKLQLKLSDC